MTLAQTDLDQKNAKFWNELCGTRLAQHYGITDHTPASLRRFDQAYFDQYPYFLPMVNLDRLANKDVLEIGLGYGSLGQRIAQSGARYTGLDIAANAVKMMNLRLSSQGITGNAILGSALEMPFPSESFDFVISIGCFHHTGNVQRCVDEAYRVLRPRGTALIMVYNKFSFRQWKSWPLMTFKELLRHGGILRSRHVLTEAQRFPYDHNSAGRSAPEIVLFSKKELRNIFHRFDNVAMQKQNADHFIVRGWRLIDRMRLLSSLGRLLGLDIYVEATKVAVTQKIAENTQFATTSAA